MPQAMRVNTVDAKNRLNELLTEIEKTKRPLVIERRGRSIAVVLDYETYERQESPKPERGASKLSRELASFQEHLKKKYPKGTGDSVEILREIRANRRGS